MHLEESLVAILKRNMEPVGAGFLVDRSLVLTCSHVVNQALGRDSYQVGRPSDQVAVRFHFLKSRVFEAVIDNGEDSWSDPPATRQLGADLCVLRCLTAPPSEISCAQLGKFSDLQGRRCRAGGFPAEWDVDFANGEITGQDENGLYLIRPSDTTLAIITTHNFARLLGPQARPPGVIHEGYSGAPVEIEGLIAGLLTEAKQKVSDATAYMIPVSHFPERIRQFAKDLTETSAVSTDLVTSNSPSRQLVSDYLNCIALDSYSSGTPAHSNTNAVDVYISRSVAMLEKSQDPTTRKTEPIGMAIQREKRFVLLGEPGIGKSTAFQYLERAVTARTLSEAYGPQLCWVPVLIELKSYRGEPELEALLAVRVNEVLSRGRKSLGRDAAESTRVMKEWLNDEKYQFLILIDALDEAPSEFYEEVRIAIEALLNRPVHFAISCRTADYDQSLQKIGPPYVLTKLRPEEIKYYLAQALPKTGDVFFHRQVKQSSEILTLASNPLLLNAMVGIIGQDSSARIADNLGQLLKQFVKAMPRRRQRKKFRLSVPLDILEYSLSVLGASMLSYDKRTPNVSEVRRWSIIGDVDQILVEARRCGYIVFDEFNTGSVEFIHPLFGDYFAAVWLSEQINEKSQNSDAILGDRIMLPRWHQAIAMVANISTQPKPIVVSIANRLYKENVNVKSVWEVFDDTISYIPLAGGLFRRIGGWTPFLEGRTKVKLLLRCWEACSDADRRDTRKIVVKALCNLLTPPFGVWFNGIPSNIDELLPATSALGSIGDPEAIPCLDVLGSITTPGFRLRTEASKQMWAFLASEARRAATEIREKNPTGVPADPHPSE